MRMTHCEGGHIVWWADLNGRLLPFVRSTRSYALEEDPQAGADAMAHPLRYCWTLHVDVCKRRLDPPGKQDE